MQNSEQSVFEAVIEPVLVSRAVKFEVDQEKHNSPTLPNILHHYSKLIINDIQNNASAAKPTSL